MVFKLIIFLVLLTTTLAEDCDDGYKQYRHGKQNKILVTNIEPIINSITEETSTESSQKATEKENINTASSYNYASYSPPSYEVTENVIDIPDDRSPAGPIITNYTKQPQLNTPQTDQTTIKIETTTSNIKSKKNVLSIFHVKAEYDDKNGLEEANVNNSSGIFKGIRNYFTELFQKRLLKGINNLFNRNEVHELKFKRSVDAQMNGRDDKQNSGGVDKTEFFVRHKHISLT